MLSYFLCMIISCCCTDACTASYFTLENNPIIDDFNATQSSPCPWLRPTMQVLLVSGEDQSHYTLNDQHPAGQPTFIFSPSRAMKLCLHYLFPSSYFWVAFVFLVDFKYVFGLPLNLSIYIQQFIWIDVFHKEIPSRCELIQRCFFSNINFPWFDMPALRSKSKVVRDSFFCRASTK